MSFNEYLNYKKKQETANKFTLKPPKGLTEKEAMFIVTTISQLVPHSPLPQDKEFKALSNDTKRYLLAQQFAKGDHVFDWAKALFKRYVINTNIYPSYPSAPYSHNVPHNRSNVFKKARAFADSYYIFRHNGNGTQNNNFKSKNPYNTPIIYLDNTKDWFKELVTIPKTQLYYPNEAKNVKQITDEYRSTAFNSCFTHQFKDKVFYFPVEAKGADGKYYSFLKQVEITKKEGMRGYMLSISLSAIPKNNSKYSHQILRIDSGGYHKNASPENVTPTVKTHTPYKVSKTSKVNALRNPNTQTTSFIPDKTTGFHFHLFTNESNFIYSKNPNTADAMGIEDVLNLWENLTYFRAKDIRPCLKQIISNENASIMYPKLYELYVMNNNLKEGNIDTSAVANYLKEKNISMIDTHIESASHFLYALDILEKMDEVINIFLNIENNPVALNDQEYLNKLYVTSKEPLQEFVSNRQMMSNLETNATSKVSETINTEDSTNTRESDDNIM